MGSSLWMATSPLGAFLSHPESENKDVVLYKYKPTVQTNEHKLGQWSTFVKATWSVRGLYFYCKIMLYCINYTYYSVKTVKICFHIPFRG